MVLRHQPLVAGIAAGLTLLIRPNLVLLALAPVFAWQEKRETLIRYAMGIVPGLLAIAVINTLLYGGPLSSGYGSLFEPRVELGAVQPAELHRVDGADADAFHSARTRPAVRARGAS